MGGGGGVTIYIYIWPMCIYISTSTCIRIHICIYTRGSVPHEDCECTSSAHVRCLFWNIIK